MPNKIFNVHLLCVELETVARVNAWLD